MGARIQTFQSPNGAPSLQQLTGSGKGQVFEINRQRTNLGRAENNQIVIQDESVSRLHAMIEQGEDGQFVIFDNQSRNGIRVNGKKTEAAMLRNGDEIVVGSVSFRIQIPESQEEMEASQLSQITTAPRKKLNPRLLLYGGLGLFVAGALFLNNDSAPKSEATSSNNKNGKGPQISVSEPPTVPADLSSGGNPVVDVAKDPVEADLEALPWADAGVTESETYFRRGQREFFGKNYHRAINSFQLALSLNKSHPAAGYYLKSAIHEAEKEAQKNYEMGIKYFEALQYSRAIYHFQQTQALLAHKPNDSILAEVEKRIKLARQRLQAAELFP